jgi:hypothetical protein
VKTDVAGPFRVPGSGLYIPAGQETGLSIGSAPKARGVIRDAIRVLLLRVSDSSMGTDDV